MDDHNIGPVSAREGPEAEARAAARVPLSALSVGQSGTIVAIGVTGPLRRRLLALGLITGEVVTITRVAPLGDPLELEVKGYRLSLRKAEASQILMALHADAQRHRSTPLTQEP